MDRKECLEAAGKAVLGESRVKKREKCAHVTVNMGA